MIVYPEDNVNRLDIIDDAIKNHYGVQFKNMFPEVPSWDSFIAHMNLSYVKKIPHESDMYLHQAGEVFFWNYLNIQVDNAHKYFTEYAKVVSKLGEIHPFKKINSAFSMLSLTNHEPSAIGKHYDHIDIFSWQCKGKAIWYIGDDNIQKFEMEPGDIVFCPAWTTHEVVSVTPRAAISSYVVTGREDPKKREDYKKNVKINQ